MSTVTGGFRINPTRNSISGHRVSIYDNHVCWLDSMVGDTVDTYRNTNLANVDGSIDGPGTSGTPNQGALGKRWAKS